MQNEFINAFSNKTMRQLSSYRIKQILENLCIMNNKLLIQYVIDYMYKKNIHYHITELLKFAHYHENTDMIDFLIKQNFARINHLLQEIINTKYLSSINFFLSCNNTNITKIQDICNKACKNAETKIVQLCIEMGATFPSDVLHCIRNSHRINFEFVKLLVDNGVINLNDGFIEVCKSYGVNIEILESFIKNNVTNLNDGFKTICQNYLVRIELVEFFIDCGVTNLNDGFIKICENNKINVRMIQLFIKYGITNLNEGFVKICEKSYLKKKLINVFINNGITNLNDGFIKICQNNNAPNYIIHDIIDFFMHKQNINKDIIKNITEINVSFNQKIEYGIALTFSEFQNVDVTKFLFVLCNHNIIIYGSKFFSLENIIKIALMIFDSVTLKSHNITYSTKITMGEKIPLKIAELLDVYGNVSSNFITDSQKRELMQSYLDQQLWKPTRYKDFPSSIKETISAFVFVAKCFSIDKLKCKIPKPLIHMIINLFIN